MKLLKRSKKVTLRLGLLGLILLSVTLTSCSSRQLVIYPIQQTDFYELENKDICMTPFYFKEVLKAKLKIK